MQPYNVRRLKNRAGRGRLEVFRAIDALVDQLLRQVPVGFVISQAAYEQLSRAPSPDAAAALVNAGVPNVPKVWTELAFEEVRREVAPDAPSRLRSVFACLDPLEALSFTEATGHGKAVWRGEVENDFPWLIVDMSHFAKVDPGLTGPADFRDQWERARAQARNYWSAEDGVTTAEVLVSGSVLLKERIMLLPMLRHLGLVV